MSNRLNLKQVTHTADLCVVGGGMAGLCAAVAAARHGVNTGRAATPWSGWFPLLGDGRRLRRL